MSAGGGFDYPVPAVRAAGSTTREASGHAGSVDLAGSAAAVATSMPGSHSAGSATRLSDSWRTGMRGLVDDLADQADALTTAATTTTANDQGVADLVGPTVPGLGPSTTPTIPGLP